MSGASPGEAASASEAEPTAASKSSDPPPPPLLEPSTRGRFAVTVALFASVLTLLVTTCSGLGYARDEGFYFEAARAYGKWFELFVSDRATALQRPATDAAFGVNHEHPALIKSLFALSNLGLERKWHVFDEPGTSFRFPAMVLAALLIASVYRWGERRFGRAAGLVGALSLLFAPRFFYHAHLACFDVPIAAMFFFTVLAYSRAVSTEGSYWPLVTGLLFGLSLDTKHNSWFLPFVVLTHLVVLGTNAWLRRERVWPSIHRSAMTLVSMALVGPIVVFVLWPWLWHDTLTRVADYARFHLQHEYYNMELFGRTYWEPPMPRSYAWVMTLATVPIVTLVAGAIGAARSLFTAAKQTRAREPLEHGGEPLLWGIAVLVCYAPWLRDSTPIFGGTKHWMTAYPFLALFVASGFEASILATRKLVAALRNGWFAYVVALVVLAPSVRESLHAHPWGLGAYTPLVGGTPGAASLGLNRSFWGYNTGAVVDYLNREVPEGGRVYIHDTAWPSWEMLQEDGRLRPDIRAVSAVSSADFALYHHEQHMQGEEYQAWVAFGTVRPDLVRGLDGVPTISVYRRSSAGTR